MESHHLPSFTIVKTVKTSKAIHCLQPILEVCLKSNIFFLASMPCSSRAKFCVSAIYIFVEIRSLKIMSEFKMSEFKFGSNFFLLLSKFVCLVTEKKDSSMIKTVRN